MGREKLVAAALIGVALACGWSATEPNATARTPERLISELQVHETSAGAADQLVRLGRRSSKVRKFVASHLPPIIERGPRPDADVWTNSVRVAADLKIGEAAPALVKWINFGQGVVSFGDERSLEDKPAAKALAAIGDPALRVLEQLLGEGERPERWEAFFVLARIGSPGAKEVLRKRLEREPDPLLRERIEGVLASR